MRRLIVFWVGRRHALYRASFENMDDGVVVVSGGHAANVVSKSCSALVVVDVFTVRGGWNSRGSWMLKARIAPAGKADGLVTAPS